MQLSAGCLILKVADLCDRVTIAQRSMDGLGRAQRHGEVRRPRGPRQQQAGRGQRSGRGRGRQQRVYQAFGHGRTQDLDPRFQKREFQIEQYHDIRGEVPPDNERSPTLEFFTLDLKKPHPHPDPKQLRVDPGLMIFEPYLKSARLRLQELVARTPAGGGIPLFHPEKYWSEGAFRSSIRKNIGGTGHSVLPLGKILVGPVVPFFCLEK